MSHETARKRVQCALEKMKTSELEGFMEKSVDSKANIDKVKKLAAERIQDLINHFTKQNY